MTRPETFKKYNQSEKGIARKETFYATRGISRAEYNKKYIQRHRAFKKQLREDSDLFDAYNHISF